MVLLGALSAQAPIGSPEYKALGGVMDATAAALKAFGYDVMITPARK
ncbi:MAG: hypothetical protein AB1592_09340 [Pseudomonadota bacterium]